MLKEREIVSVFTFNFQLSSYLILKLESDRLQVSKFTLNVYVKIHKDRVSSELIRPLETNLLLAEMFDPFSLL